MSACNQKNKYEKPFFDALETVIVTDSLYIENLESRSKSEKEHAKAVPYLKMAIFVSNYISKAYFQTKRDTLEELNYALLNENLNQTIDSFFFDKSKDFFPNFSQDLKTKTDIKKTISNRLDFANQLVKTQNYLLKYLSSCSYGTDCGNFDRGYYTQYYNDTISNDSIIVAIRKNNNFEQKYHSTELYNSSIYFSQYDTLLKKETLFDIINYNPIIYSKKIHKKDIKKYYFNLVKLTKNWGTKIDTMGLWLNCNSPLRKGYIPY